MKALTLILALGLSLFAYGSDLSAEPPEVANPKVQFTDQGAAEDFANVKKVQLSAFARLSQFTMTATDTVNRSSARIVSKLIPGFLLQGAYRFSDYWMVLAQVTGDFAKFEAPANKSLVHDSQFVFNSKLGAMYFTEQNFYIAGELLLGHQFLGAGRSPTVVELDRFMTPGVGFRVGYWWAPDERLTFRPEVGFSSYISQERAGYRYRYGLNYQAGITALYVATEAMAFRGGFTFTHHTDEATITSQSRTDYGFEMGTTFNTDWF